MQIMYCGCLTVTAQHWILGGGLQHAEGRMEKERTETKPFSLTNHHLQINNLT